MEAARPTHAEWLARNPRLRNVYRAGDLIEGEERRRGRRKGKRRKKRKKKKGGKKKKWKRRLRCGGDGGGDGGFRRPMEHGASRRYHEHRGAGRSSPSGVHATRDARVSLLELVMRLSRGLFDAPSRRTIESFSKLCARFSPLLNARRPIVVSYSF